jgi:hypothetical protein
MMNACGMIMTSTLNTPGEKSKKMATISVLKNVMPTFNSKMVTGLKQQKSTALRSFLVKTNENRPKKRASSRHPYKLSVFPSGNYFTDSSNLPYER